MSNTSQTIPPNVSTSNVDKKHLISSTINVTNPNDLTSIAVNIPAQSIHSRHTNNLNNNNNANPDETSSRQTLVHSHSGETKRVERTSRKECYRLGRRKLLFEKRRKASDYALFFAMIGLFLMVLEQELTMAKVYDKVKKKKQYEQQKGTIEDSSCLVFFLLVLRLLLLLLFHTHIVLI